MLRLEAYESSWISFSNRTQLCYVCTIFGHKKANIHNFSLFSTFGNNHQTEINKKCNFQKMRSLDFFHFFWVEFVGVWSIWNKKKSRSFPKNKLQSPGLKCALCPWHGHLAFSRSPCLYPVINYKWVFLNLYCSATIELTMLGNRSSYRKFFDVFCKPNFTLPLTLFMPFMIFFL